jgi:two-component system, NtrC family, response regulator AtoC
VGFRHRQPPGLRLDTAVPIRPEAGDRIEPADMSAQLGQRSTAPAAREEPRAAPTPAPGATSMRRLADEVDELERRRMTEALAEAGGVKTRAAGMLGMPIRTFTWKLKQHRIC